MSSIVQVATVPSLAARRAFGARVITWPVFGSLRRVDDQVVPPPGAGWRRLDMRLAGICGSDIAALSGRSPTVLWPLVSFPSVPGHEIVATRATEDMVEAADDPAHARASSSARVVVDPYLSCQARGLVPPCPECQRGQTSVCRRAGAPSEGLGAGMMIGYHRDLPGGWSDCLWAHESQLHPVPDAIGDEAALLVEPVAVALHGLCQIAWDGSERVLVVGGGTIGLATVAALRILGLPAPLVATRHSHQAIAAAALGGHPVVGDGTRWPRLGGACAVAGWLGRPLWLGGFDVVVDAVGTDRTLARAAEAVRAGGAIVRIGDVGTLPRSRDGGVWAPDVRVISPFGYGRETMPDGTVGHAFDLVVARIGSLQEPLGALVTHTYTLENYRPALAAAVDHRRNRSIKVAFRGKEATPRR